MKRLIIDKFYGWIWNDPYVWWVGSFLYAEWVEIRKESKKVRLSKSLQSTSLISTNITNSIVTWYNTVDSTHFIRTHYDWKITNFLKNNIDNWLYIVDLDWNAYNTGVIGTKWFIIWSTKIYNWTYDSTSASLWMYADASSSIVTNWDFSSWTWWTIPANWSISWWLATHTAWATNVLSQVLTTVTTSQYRVEALSDTINAWSCEVKLWWVSIWTLSTSNKYLVWTMTAVSTGSSLEFVPTTDFEWSITDVNVREYNVVSQDYDFNAKAPFIIINNFIYVWNWNKITEIDTTDSTWVFLDVLTIDTWYVIKWITQIGDQIYIYASNWNTSKQYIWNWVDTTANVIITWVDKNIVNVANFANQDYIITQSIYTQKTAFWRVRGYQLELIYQNDLTLDWNNERVCFNIQYINAIETIGNILLLPWFWWIYSFGQHSPWYPYSIQKEYLNLWCEFSWKYWVTAMSYTESNSNNMRYSYIWMIWSTTPKVYEELVQFWAWNYSYITPWFIELYPVIWDCISNSKTLEKVTVWYKLETDTFINIYTKDNDRAIKYANILYNYTTIPTVWAIYTLSWNTHTIYAVTDMWDYCILHTTYTWTDTSYYWQMTKSSWIWDASIYAERIKYWYKFEWSITDTSLRRWTINIATKFHELQIAIELITKNQNNTPEFSDINIYYNETNDD